jgi:hypothetical protein
VILTDFGWGLVYLCFVITVGSLVAGGFTLRRVAEHRRLRMQEKSRGVAKAVW